MALYLGIAAFILFFVYDVNSFLWQRSIPRTFFVTGALLLAVSLIIELRTAWPSFSGWGDILLLVLGVLSFIALIYTLFFAIPFDETYAKQSNGRSVCDHGVYGLCRHPGILCFFGMCLFTGLAALPSLDFLIHGMIFSLLNLLYAWFQDRITFPRTFADYREYRQKVPFLFPTKASLKHFFKTFGHSATKEVES